MSTTTLTKSAHTLVAASSNAAGAWYRGAHDMRSALGGIITGSITNGATGPTTQCEMRIMVAHDDGSTPATGAAGAVWKTVRRFGGGTTANDVSEFSWEVPPGVQHVQVEFIGNTGQAVTVAASISTVDSAASS